MPITSTLYTYNYGINKINTIQKATITVLLHISRHILDHFNLVKYVLTGICAQKKKYFCHKYMSCYLFVLTRRDRRTPIAKHAANAFNLVLQLNVDESEI